MNNLTTFTFNTSPLRVVEIDGNPWFVAADVCRVLGLTDVSKAKLALADPEKGVKRIRTLGGPQTVGIISESGLYRLTMRSDKPNARPFQDWVTRDVLPAIRKDGMYVKGEEKVATGELSEDALTLLVIGRLKAKMERLQAEKVAAEAKVIELQPAADLVEDTFQGQRSLQDVVRKLDGVNTMVIKRDLSDANFLYRKAGAYRVYSKFRTLFVEKYDKRTGSHNIFATPAGALVIGQLYRKGKLTARRS